MRERRHLPRAGVRGVAVGRARQLVEEQIEHQRHPANRPNPRPFAGLAAGRDRHGRLGESTWSGRDSARLIDAGNPRALVKPARGGRSQREPAEKRQHADQDHRDPDGLPHTGNRIDEDAPHNDPEQPADRHQTAGSGRIGVLAGQKWQQPFRIAHPMEHGPELEPVSDGHPVPAGEMNPLPGHRDETQWKAARCEPRRRPRTRRRSTERRNAAPHDRGRKRRAGCRYGCGSRRGEPGARP